MSRYNLLYFDSNGKLKKYDSLQKWTRIYNVKT